MCLDVAETKEFFVHRKTSKGHSGQSCFFLSTSASSQVRLVPPSDLQKLEVTKYKYFVGVLKKIFLVPVILSI